MSGQVILLTTHCIVPIASSDSDRRLELVYNIIVILNRLVVGERRRSRAAAGFNDRTEAGKSC